MQWALVDANNIIQNLIAYDGASEYVPPEGLSLQQVDDEKNIGDLCS